jgi:hypothetical protein
MLDSRFSVLIAVAITEPDSDGDEHGKPIAIADRNGNADQRANWPAVREDRKRQFCCSANVHVACDVR